MEAVGAQEETYQAGMLAADLLFVGDPPIEDID